MPQLQRVQPGRHRDHPPGLARKGRGIGVLRRLLQECRVIIGQIQRQDLCGQLRVVEPAPGFEVGPGEFLRDIQPPVRRETAHDGLGGRDGRVMAACALILHNVPLSLGRTVRPPGPLYVSH